MDKPTFKAFLSHRYKSPEVNQRFFEALSSHGNLHFEVDTGENATNVTRLERFVRDADAFVGIYPFPPEEDALPAAEKALPDTRPTAAKALHSSRYFRLELDLALRSRRPAIVFVDARYGTAITVPHTARVFRYDPHEALGTVTDRRQHQLAQLTQEFCEDVAASMRLRYTGLHEPGDGLDRVGILVPPQSREGAPGYSTTQVSRMQERLAGYGLNPILLPWNSVLDGRFMRELRNLDWAVVDIGADACASGLPAFLQGYFLPQLRLMRVEKGQATRSPLETTLLGAFEVGYPKDIVRWSDDEELDREFALRLSTLYAPRRYIRTPGEAQDYFQSAARRKEHIFLSYSGEDRDYAAALRKALLKRFQQVFDYRDGGESIAPGQPWTTQIFDKLAVSAIGVALLSPTYFRSGNCQHEMQDLVALQDAGKLRLFPVKLAEGSLEMPALLGNLQYFRAWEHASPDALAEKIASVYASAPPPHIAPPAN